MLASSLTSILLGRVWKRVVSVAYPRRIFSWVILLHTIPAVRAQSGDEFSNNLFTDLAPLLALFGEDVVKQYLSQSTRAWEHVIFACGPLGIITAVTSAIRVAGPKSLMGLIGRAREPRAEAEIQLMSSTSSEVCELWNGAGIVRVNGSPDIIELMYDPLYAQAQHAGAESQLGIYTLHDLAPPPDPPGEGLLSAVWNRVFGRNFDPRPIPIGPRAAPNISLNIAASQASSWELVIIGCVGLALQIGVLIFEGLITYHSRWKKGTQDVAGYAFPLTALGTLAISGGLFICAHVIEASTIEQEYGIAFQGRPLQILWLQRHQSVSDQEFSSYAIYASKNQNRLLTSRPSLAGGRELQRLTVAAVISTIIGFVAQFIGLRAMHFSASLANLIVAGIMTVLRTVLRRSLTMSPDNRPVPSNTSFSVRKLVEGHELDLIAKEVLGCPRWMVVTHMTHSTQHQEGITRGLEVWQARIRLGKIAKLAAPRWEGEFCATIDNITDTIQAVANSLWSPLGGILPSESFEKLTRLDWYLLVDTYEGGQRERIKIQMTMTREDADGRGSWIAKREEIAALLCLWMSGFKQTPIERSKKQKTLWFLSCDNRNGDLARLLSDWWISRESNRVEVPSNFSGLGATVQEDHILDCVFPLDYEKPVLAVKFPQCDTSPQPAFITQSTLLQMCAQYLLSSFVSFAVRHIDRIKSSTVIRVVDDQRILTMVNDDVRGLADTVQRFGLATLEDSLRIVVLALSQANKMPLMAPFILKIVHDGGKGWPPMTTTGGNVQEFYRLVQCACIEEVELLIGQNRWGAAGSLWRTLKSTFAAILEPLNPRIIVINNITDSLYRQILNRDNDPSYSLPANQCQRHATSSAGRFPLHDAITRSCLWDVYHAVDTHDEQIDSVINSVDDNRRTPLHLAALSGDISISRLLLFLGACPNILDPATSSTALHFSVTKDGDARADLASLLLQNGAMIDARDTDGNTAFILAAQKGCCKLLSLLKENAADVDAMNQDGDTALLVGARGGHDAVIRYLVTQNAKLDISNKNGNTALYIAAQAVNRDIVNLLVDAGAKMDLGLAAENGFDVALNLLVRDANISSEEIHNAAILATKNGFDRVVELLLEKGADIEIRDQQGDTLLIIAARKGHHSVLKLLLSQGADANAVGLNNNTALLAAGGKYDLVIELLLETGVEANVRDRYQTTPLHQAAQRGNYRVVKLLVDYGADITAKSDDESTPLHYAANSGRESVVRLICRKQPNLNAQDVNGDTALSVAVQGRHYAVAEFLLEQGADANIPNTDNVTPIQWASQEGQESICKLLTNHRVLPSA